MTFYDVKKNENIYKSQISNEQKENRFQILFKTANIFIIVYDLTREESFQKCIKWREEISKKNTFANIVLVGTKDDLMTEFNLQRKSEEEIQSFCQANQIDQHFFVSSKNGKNIDKLFEYLKETLKDKNQKRMSYRFRTSSLPEGMLNFFFNNLKPL